MKTIFKFMLVAVLIIGCTQDDDRNTDFTNSIPAPINVSAQFRITQDNSGLVTITPLAEGVANFKLEFGDASEPLNNIQPGSSINHTYAEGVYDVGITANGINGLSTSVTEQIVVSFIPPENIEISIENDPAISKRVNVSVNADFAMFYQVDFGEVEGAEPLSANIGEGISFTYQEAGTFTISIEVFGGAAETVVITEEFEVTAIEQPLASAPTPPARASTDVISLFTTVYDNVPDTDFFPDWGQGGCCGSGWTLFELEGDEMLQYTNLSFQGNQLAQPIDVSEMEFIHLDVWTTDVLQTIEVSLISLTNGERPVVVELTPNSWTSINIPISSYTDQDGFTVNDIHQIKYVGDPFAGGGTAFIDNIYFYRASTTTAPFDDGLLTNGNFENGSEAWIVGVNDNNPAPVVTVDGNSFYSVDVTNAGTPFSVNLSQKLEIIQGETYILTFDAWSDVNRSIIAGIGLSGGNFANNSVPVNITPTVTNYSRTLTAEGFGALDARVLFDVGAETGMVNIDNVSLNIVVNNLLTNGDFENGSEAWIVGVNDNNPAPVVTVDGNTFYSVDVTVAGNPFDVNLSQKLEIIQGETYTLTFDAWSDVNRSIIAGIGLSGGNFANNSETINITPTVTNYSRTLTADGFGALDARVLFDVGAETGMVNIDNVILSIN